MIRTAFFVLTSIILLQCTARYSITTESRSVYDAIDTLKHTKRMELMTNTAHQTPAFIYDSGKDGDAVMIVGGTHGNEPAGYEAALRLVDILIKRPVENGRVILIPLANRRSVENYKRRIPVPDGVDRELGNLNRCYPGSADGLPMQQMAYQIEQLARQYQVKALIDLHEARYLHLNTPDESDRDMGLGQTIIYYPNIASSELIIPMLDGINEDIADHDQLFSAVEMPILNSAAWWAGKYLDIAAFTFETTRILDLEQRVAWHLKLVTIVLKSMNLWSSDGAE